MSYIDKPLFSAIKSQMTVADQTAFENLVQMSPTLRGMIDAYELKVNEAGSDFAAPQFRTAAQGGAAMPLPRVVAGQVIPGLIFLDSSEANNPIGLIATLAHELGHFADRVAYTAAWNAAYTSRDQEQIANVCLMTEGRALNANLKVAVEIYSASQSGSDAILIPVWPNHSPEGLIAFAATVRADLIARYPTASAATLDGAVAYALTTFYEQQPNYGQPLVNGVLPTLLDRCMDVARSVAPATTTPAPQLPVNAEFRGGVSGSDISPSILIATADGTIEVSLDLSGQASSGFLTMVTKNQSGVQVSSYVVSDGQRLSTINTATGNISITYQNTEFGLVVTQTSFSNQQAGTVTNPHLDLTNNISPTGQPIYTGGNGDGGAPVADGSNNLVYSQGSVQIHFTGASTNGAHNVAGLITTGGWMPGADQISPISFTADILGATLPAYNSLTLTADNAALWGAGIASLSQGAVDYLAIDPLVIDLNGDGVRLTSYRDAPVLFDIDHDAGATREQTGWVSAQDGILVKDLNGNGVIDGIHEILSDYYGGSIGTSGTSGPGGTSAGTPGTRPHANAYAALQRLDTGSGIGSAGYHDGVFTSLDAEWNNLRVWVDANHDGKTDSGELKTFAQLGITSINLASTSESGLINGGNEVIASGSATINGQSRQVQAVNLLANPLGHTFTAQSGGIVISTEGNAAGAASLGTYVSTSTTGEVINLATKGVSNATGGSGNDTLTGTAGNNWLAGGQGSDTFNAGAGDDILLIDAQDLQANIHGGAGFDVAQVVSGAADSQGNYAGITLNLTQAELEVVEGGRGNDVLIGGGRSNVFIAGGDGDDIAKNGSGGWFHGFDALRVATGTGLERND